MGLHVYMFSKAALTNHDYDKYIPDIHINLYSIVFLIPGLRRAAVLIEEGRWVRALGEMSGWDVWTRQLLHRNIDGVSYVSAHHGGLFGFDGKLWAGTDDFMKRINPTSLKKMHDAIDRGAAAVSKVELGGKKYFVLKNDPSSNFVILKSTDRGAGCTVAKSNTCLVVGIYDNDSVQPANNTSQICDIRDHLVDAGY
ncbi:hypothetical protein LOTGIDRAFT_237126 [Lottia gigantea]|uniref:Profilin n=1 Tax=Lottia gigantea TaxID=225164 RepID=V3ZMR8_LOTGI|nr:hypothetical protein LOTGIDRAFT_237126 [Lottia gigantea]ESO82131.1 hypothetical protein LOTGIDRAFT_237126 [Lottia gigantea]